MNRAIAVLHRIFLKHVFLPIPNTPNRFGPKSKLKKWFQSFKHTSQIFPNLLFVRVVIFPLHQLHFTLPSQPTQKNSTDSRHRNKWVLPTSMASRRPPPPLSKISSANAAALPWSTAALRRSLNVMEPTLMTLFGALNVCSLILTLSALYGSSTFSLKYCIIIIIIILSWIDFILFYFKKN